MTAIELKRKLDLEKLKLQHGAHNSPEQGFCVMEAVAYVAGEPHSDHPECVSPIIGAFLRTWNDCLDEAGRQRLKPYIPKVVGTRATADVEDRRRWLCADWLVRQYTPAWLELAGLKDQAAALRAIGELHDLKSATAAQPVVRVAEQKASAARSAAWSAAESTAESAARSAAWSAAEKILNPTKQSLQESAFQLLDKLIVLGAKENRT